MYEAYALPLESKERPNLAAAQVPLPLRPADPRYMPSSVSLS